MLLQSKIADQRGSYSHVLTRWLVDIGLARYDRAFIDDLKIKSPIDFQLV